MSIAIKNRAGDVVFKTHFSDMKRAVAVASNSGVDLSHADFSGHDLSAVDFSFKNLSNANFSKCNLRFANFSGSSVNDADFTKADMSCVKLQWAKISNAILTGCNLAKNCLAEADITDAELERLFNSIKSDDHSDLFNNSVFTNKNLLEAQLIKFYDCFNYHGKLQDFPDYKWMKENATFNKRLLISGHCTTFIINVNDQNCSKDDMPKNIKNLITEAQLRGISMLIIDFN